MSSNPKPQAVQTVKKAPNGKWETVRFGWCPDHKDKKGFMVRSSDYAGITEAGFEFICRETREHTRHRFYNRVPRNLPKTPAEAALWFQTEVSRMVVNPAKSPK